MKTEYFESSRGGGSHAVVGFLVSVVLLFAASQADSAVPGCVPAPAGLASWWRGENSTADATGGNNGTIAGTGIVTYGAGIVGQAFVFDGTHRDRVDLGNPTDLQLENFTLEAWVKRSSPTVATFDILGMDGSVCGDGACIIGFGRGGYIFALANDGRLILSRTDLDGLISAPLVADTDWHHLAVTKSGTNAVFYIDGVPQATPPYDHPSPYTFDDATCSCSAAIAIGSRGDARGGTFFGMIDEPAVFNRALSASEIQAIYTAGSAGKCAPTPACVPAPSGLISWWRSESNALDEIGGNSGTLAGNAAYGAGVAGQCFVFDGNRDGVCVGSSSSLQLQNLSIEGWIKRSSATQASFDGNGNGEIFVVGTYPGGCRFGIRQTDNHLEFGKPSDIQVSSAAQVADTNWHHVAVTRQGTQVVFYVDGVAYAAPAYTASPFSFSAPGYIGAWWNPYGQVDNSFYGAIDELAVYNRELTAAELQAIYAAGSAGKCAPGVAPSIITQPVSETVRAGSDVTFTVTAAGIPPLSYQWRFNGTNIAGATATSLILANVQPAQAGDYSVRVTNAFGAIISSNAVLAVIPSSTNCAPPPAGLVSWWRSESNALDEAGGNSGTLAGNAAYGAGKAGSCFVFDGNRDGVYVGTNSSLQLQDFTIEAWIKRTSARTASFNGNGNGTIFACGPGGGGYNFFVQQSDNRLTLAKSQINQVSSDARITDTNWHHVAVTKRGTAVLFYVDGVAYVAPTYDSGGYTFGAPGYIGAWWNPYGQVDNSFYGAIDELAVYDRELTAAELQAIYNAGSAGKCPVGVAPSIITQPANQTVAAGSNATFTVTAVGTRPLSYQWRLKGTNIAGASATSFTLSNVQPAQAGNYTVRVTNTFGSIISSNALLTVTNPAPTCVTPPPSLVSWWRGEGNTVDSTDSSIGTPVGNVTFGTGRVGQAFVLDGSGDGVSVGNPTNLQLQNFTIEAWIKRGNASLASLGGEGAGHVFGGSYGGYVLGLWDNGQLTLGKIGVSGVQSSRAITDTNGFHHVAVTKNGSTVVFYVDGAGETAAAYNPGFVFSGGFVIGARGGDYGASFLGSLDEVSIYNRALSAAEIQSLYSADGAGKCTGSTAPFITSQPTNQTVSMGGTATFTVAAGGTPPLSYQWRFNGTNIAWATSTSLNFTNVQLLQAGIYAVRVTNVFGSVLSSSALLTVIPASTNCAPAPAGGVGWWPGEGNANDAADSNNGSLRGGVSFAIGMVGQAFRFNGTNSYVEVPDSPGLRLTNQLTIEFWVKRQQVDWQTDYLVNKGGDWARGALNYGVAVPGPQWNSMLQFLFAGGNRGAGSVSDLNWHHCAIVARNGDVDPTFYLDGVPQPVTYRQGASTIRLYPSTEPLHIGAQLDPAWNYYSKTIIDELSLYNRALTAAEIQAVYLAGSLGKCTLNRVPVAVCANAVVSAGTNCQAGASVNNGSFDPDGDPITVSQVPPGPYPLGTNSVTLTVSDNHGASNSCSALVIVQDRTRPVILCASNKAVECGAAWIFDSPFAFDDCSATNVLVSVASTVTNAGCGSTFTATRTWLAVDGFTNTATCSQTVMVLDTTPPTLVCPAPRTVEFQDENGAVVPFVVTANDTCSSVSLVVTPASGSAFPIGVTPVQATAMDACTNASQCGFTVTVLGAQGVKSNVLAELIALRASTTLDESLAVKFDSAIQYLQDSLNPACWIDQTHLHPKSGNGAMNDEKLAASKLAEIMEAKGCPVEPAVLEGFIDRIVRCDRLLAMISIQDAANAGLNAKKVAQDYALVAKGDREADAGHYANAIEHYRNAWRHALQLQLQVGVNADGSVRLQFVGNGSTSYLIEVSTDLVNWVPLGTCSADAEGNVAFTDPAAAGQTGRFYRVVEQ